MSKKHFKALAATLNYAKPVGNGQHQDLLLSQWEDLVKRIARTCGGFNSNFDYSRFYEACGLGQ